MILASIKLHGVYLSLLNLKTKVMVIMLQDNSHNYLEQTCVVLRQALKRLALLDKAMEINTEKSHFVILQAVKSAISSQGGTRIVGAEHQGTKPELIEWQPKTYTEIYAYWQHHLNTLIDLIKHDKITEQVKNVFGHELRGLIKYPIQQQLDSVFKEVIRLSGKYWPSASQAITHAFQFDTKSLETEQIELLKSWEQLLSPDDNNLEEKLKLIILNPSREYVKDKDGHYIDVAAEDAKALAESIKETYNDLILILRCC